MLFQSTLPSQGATAEGLKIRADLLISIHAPLTGSDEYARPFWTQFTFQSTLPSQGATDAWFAADASLDISIHAPLTGSDRGWLANSKTPQISIHAPLTGSDRSPIVIFRRPARFQSTLPSQGATTVCHNQCQSVQFQSTLPSQGTTSPKNPSFLHDRHFNPRSPHRERPSFNSSSQRTQDFNPRSPHRERPL